VWANFGNAESFAKEKRRKVLCLKRKIKKYHAWANFGNAESFAKENASV
jgi:hypothetical protein